MNKKLLLNMVKSKSNPFKEITDEHALIKVLVKEAYGETTNKQKLRPNNKKKYIMFDERRHKSPTIKKTSIGDDSITKRRVRDIIKRVF